MSNNFIDLNDAIELTKNYRNNKDAMVTPEFKDSMHISETFDAAAIQAILNQPSCVSFRSYFGMKVDKTICLIFVGVDSNNEDIVEGVKYEKGVLVEYGQKCPPLCSIDSPLNS